jgi:putative transposase
VRRALTQSILASAIAPRQDLHAYLTVLRAAVRQHGSPEAIVSDSGGVFLAKDARRIYDLLGVRKEEIDKQQAWQNYIESQFNVQRRMADWHFAHAEDWAQLREMHDRWVADFNYQQHWAHRERQDERHSPAEVLGWVHGTARTDAELERIFRLRAGRRIDRSGYVRYRCWRLYAERGLARRGGEVWLCGETLTIEHADVPLSQFDVEFQADREHLRRVTHPRLFDHPFPSPQPLLWPAGAVEWPWCDVCRPPRPAAGHRSAQCRRCSSPCWARTAAEIRPHRTVVRQGIKLADQAPRDEGAK